MIEGARLRMALWLLVSLAGARFATEVVSYAAPGHGEDVAQHWVAPRVLAAGGDPYSPGALRDLGDSLGLIPPGTGSYGFLGQHHYPPLNLLVWAPLSLLPYRAAALCWLAGSVGLWILAILLLERVLGVAAGSEVSLLLRAAMLVFAPALGVMSLGQMDILIFVLLLAALRLEDEGRVWTAGAPIALAILLKLLPVAWLLWWIVLRRGRMLASIGMWLALLTAGSLLVLGPAPHRAFVVSETRFAAAETGWERYMPSNLSPQAFVLKGIAFATGGHEHERAGILIGRTLVLGVLPAVVWIVARARRRGRRAQLAGLGLVCVWASMASAMTWQHHLVPLALPLGLALSWAWEDGDTRGFLRDCLLPFILVGILDPWMQPWRDLTGEMPRAWRDLAWSVTPTLVALGAVLTGIGAARMAIGRGYAPACEPVSGSAA